MTRYSHLFDSQLAMSVLLFPISPQEIFLEISLWSHFGQESGRAVTPYERGIAYPLNPGKCF